MQNSLLKMSKRPALWQIALACYWTILFFATHIPPSGSPSLAIPWSDKLVHLVAFAILALLFATTWEVSSGRLTGSHLRWAWIVLALYGAIDEWTQPLAGRRTSLWDWICDVGGALIGLATFAFFMNWIRRDTRDGAG